MNSKCMKAGLWAPRRPVGWLDGDRVGPWECTGNPGRRIQFSVNCPQAALRRMEDDANESSTGITAVYVYVVFTC